MPTGTDVAGASSILFSHPLSLSFSLSRSVVFRSLILFRSDQMERCSSPNLFFSLPTQCSESCNPACYPPSLSVHKRAALPRSQCPFPPDKGRQRPFSPGLARLRSVCLYCTEPVSLSHCVPSFFLQKKGVWGPGPLPQAREGGPGREYIISFSALVLGGDWGVKPLELCV